MNLRCAEKEVNAIKFTMLAGANCNARNDFGYAPGVIAILEEKPDILKTILEGGGNPDIADNEPDFSDAYSTKQCGSGEENSHASCAEAVRSRLYQDRLHGENG